jgi:hypothetical protein
MLPIPLGLSFTSIGALIPDPSLPSPSPGFQPLFINSFDPIPLVYCSNFGGFAGTKELLLDVVVAAGLPNDGLAGISSSLSSLLLKNLFPLDLTGFLSSSEDKSELLDMFW